MVNMNPFGDNGLMFAGMGHVSVFAIMLFSKIKKGSEDPFEVPLLCVGLLTLNITSS